MSNLVDLNGGGSMWRVRVVAFLNSKSSGAVYVPKAHSIAILVRGHTPEFIECEHGAYEVDCPINKSGTWPLALCIIPLKHKVAWANLTVKEVGKMLDRVDRSLDRRFSGLPINNGDTLQ